MNNTQPYRVAIVGAGRIGSTFDAPGTKNVLTHAHAFSTNPRTTLVALVDTNREHGKKEAARWGAAFFDDVGKMFEAVKPDIVVIATPDSTHVKMLQLVLSKNPKLIVYEKPVATKAGEVAQLQTLKTNIPIIVNFRRRFDTTTIEVARALKAGEYGKVISASAIYDRGILHNASHVLDQARLFFGETLTATPHFSLADYPGDVASVSGVATFERCSEFFLMHGDGRIYSLMETDIVTEKKRIRFVNDGFEIETQEVIPDPIFAGFNTLSEAKKEKTGMASAMSELAAHCVRVIEGGEEPRSTLASALKTQAACEQFATLLKK
jgi:predicted dehydrogenase